MFYNIFYLERETGGMGGVQAKEDAEDAPTPLVVRCVLMHERQTAVATVWTRAGDRARTDIDEQTRETDRQTGRENDIHTNTRTYTTTQAHTCTHTCTHTHPHAHTHTHMRFAYT